MWLMLCLAFAFRLTHLHSDFIHKLKRRLCLAQWEKKQQRKTQKPHEIKFKVHIYSTLCTFISIYAWHAFNKFVHICVRLKWKGKIDIFYRIILLLITCFFAFDSLSSVWRNVCELFYAFLVVNKEQSYEWIRLIYEQQQQNESHLFSCKLMLSKQEKSGLQA